MAFSCDFDSKWNWDINLFNPTLPQTLDYPLQSEKRFRNFIGPFSQNLLIILHARNVNLLNTFGSGLVLGYKLLFQQVWVASPFKPHQPGEKNEKPSPMIGSLISDSYNDVSGYNKLNCPHNKGIQSILVSDGTKLFKWSAQKCNNKAM